MSIYIKCVSAVLITLILHLVLSKSARDFSFILSVAASSIILFVVFDYLKPVIDFFIHLQDISALDTGMFGIILKSVAIGLLSEIVCAFCSDAGNSTLSKTLHIVATSIILYISIPLFEALITFIEEIFITI